MNGDTPGPSLIAKHIFMPREYACFPQCRKLITCSPTQPQGSSKRARPSIDLRKPAMKRASSISWRRRLTIDTPRAMHARIYVTRSTCHQGRGGVGAKPSTSRVSVSTSLRRQAKRRPDRTRPDRTGQDRSGLRNDCLSRVRNSPHAAKIIPSLNSLRHGSV